jgi:hypothetical protein
VRIAALPDLILRAERFATFIANMWSAVASERDTALELAGPEE